jgi:hypothetical protein
MLIGEIVPSNNYFVAPSSESEFLLQRAKISSNVIFCGHRLGENLGLKVLHDILLFTARIYQTLEYVRNHIPYTLE